MKNFRLVEIVQMIEEYEWLIGAWNQEKNSKYPINKESKGLVFGACRAHMKKLA